ncbi:MAG: hypothetical protein M3261_00215 [Thermoproteota archaeon]|nr:hypothetical protein [Thermoproteota archaeon]
MTSQFLIGLSVDLYVTEKICQSTEQLVTKIVVRDIKRSTKSYRDLGFKVLRDAGDS